MNRRRGGSCVLVLLLAGTGIACCDETAEGEPPVPVLWENPEVELPDAAFFDERPWLLDLSNWSAPGCGAGQPDAASHMGDFAVGNGFVFALSGYACPLNTLHTMTGPSYQKDEFFFDDTWSEVRIDGQAATIEEGRMFRVRRTAILVARERSEKLDVFSVTFAPLPDDRLDPVRRAVVRAFVIRNRTSGTVRNLELYTKPGRSEQNSRRRSLVLLQPQDASDPSSVPIGELGPGEERLVVMAYLLSIEGHGESETRNSLRQRGLDALLTQTVDGWRAFFDRAALLKSPDARVDDLYTGLLLAVRAQQDHQGGVSPMSEYSRIWTRDTAGPLRLFVRAGLFEDARAILDYYHTAAVSEGDIKNSYDLDHDPADAPEEPDWASKGEGTFSGRESAEAPNYVPLMARWYALASGDHSLVQAWFPFFRRALDGQVRNERGLQTFSGDETFRAAMSIANGRHLEGGPPDNDYSICCLSANSAFLYVAGAQALAAEAEAIGRDLEAEALREEASRVRAAAEQTFWHLDGYYVPFVDQTAPDKSEEPYEDVSTKPLWTGYLPAGDERALQNLGTVVERLGRPDGMLVSRIHPDYEGTVGAFLGRDVKQGVYTGMNHGYALYNLAVADHPTAQDAFNSLARVVSPSGNMAEYQVYDDHSALQIVYDPSGVTGDYTARFRPWEGGIVAEALIVYLTGFEPDATARTVRLAPRLPNDWPSMTWSGLRVGGTRFDLLVRQRGDRRSFCVGPTDGGNLVVELSAPLPACRIAEVTLNGRRLKDGEYELSSPFGMTRVVFPAASITPVDSLLAGVVCAADDR